jgi:hypoxanthine phosphoribosyltransferase
MSDSGQLYKNIGKTHISEKRIKSTVARLGKKISKDHRHGEVTLVSNLKGSFRFVSDLASQLTIPVRIDFISFRSYTGTEREGMKVRIEKDLDLDIRGKDVILVEDIVDTGLTLDHIIRYFEEFKKPRSVKVCALLNKPSRRLVPVQIDYIGFEVPDKFLVGYGLDHEEYFRELNIIAEYKMRQK